MTEINPDIVYTESQQVGLQKFDQFLKSPERIFLLKGKAGTGKTTIISEALKWLLLKDKYSENKNYNVLGVTVSHKAKEMLRYSIPYVNTFASVFGHREHKDEDGNKTFRPNKKAIETADCNQKWRVVVFDECSMVNRAMLKMISSYLHTDSKIIFMGDRGQLPPIEEESSAYHSIYVDPDKDSPVFDLDLPNFCTHELTERVRQTEGNPIIDLSDVIYGEIFGDKDIQKVKRHLEQTKLVDDKGHRSIKAQDMYDVFANISKDNFLDTKLIAYRRNTVNGFNSYLRNYIHYDPIHEYIPNEIIYMNSNYYMNDGNYSFKVHNSSEHIIKSVEQSEFNGIPVHMVEVKNDIWLPTLQGPYNSHSMNLYRDRLDELRAEKNWDEFYSFKDNTFANFSYGYCLTAYKAQGSTYNNAFVSANDIFDVKKISHKRKLQALYTSLTRARENAFFIN